MVENNLNWKDEAVTLYAAGIKINKIAELVCKSRKAISEHINSLDNLAAIKDVRTELKKNERKEQKRTWKAKFTEAEKAQLKRQHDIDVTVLSKERFFD
ncbi:MAG TPA: hypothetical protein DC000_02695 [Clostridiales bacterium]|nr:hypothetical protein [Clostridiales bacterium]